MVESVVDPVDDGAVGEDRGEAAPARLEQGRLAVDVEKALVLAGKAGGRQVLSGRRAAHRDGKVLAAVAFERAIGVGNLLS